MFQILDGYVDKARPHLQTAATIAMAMAERIVARLDCIIDTLQTEEFLEIRNKQYFVLAVGTPQAMTQVPATEQWELEFIACSGGGAVVNISEAADGPFRYVKAFSAADTQPGLGLIFGGGSSPIISVTGAGANVSVQFKRKVIQPRYHPTPGMQEARDTKNGVPYGARSNDGRHASALVGQKITPVGTSKGDGLRIGPFGDASPVK